jgi:hypothetical protein
MVSYPAKKVKLTGIYLSSKYLLARLSANEGRIMKTHVNKSLIRSTSKGVSAVSGPPDVMTIKIPIIPNATDAYINKRLAIFLINTVYQLKNVMQIRIILLKWLYG